MLRKLLYGGCMLALLVVLTGCAKLALEPAAEQTTVIDSFEQCVAAGNPVMESYPRQCRAADGRMFAEPQTNTGIANPASVNCKKQGGKLEIRTSLDGGQFGQCIFDDGSECEEWQLLNGKCEPAEIYPDLSLEKGAALAEKWIKEKAPTYLFDGQELSLVSSQVGGCLGCLEYKFSFISTHAGYGNRGDQVLAQVLTTHSATVKFDGGKLVSVMADGEFDELAAAEAADSISFKLYFSNTEKDPEMLDCGKVYAVERSMPRKEFFPEKAVDALLAGPSAEEKKAGYLTSINSGTKLNAYRVAEGTAYLDFDKRLEYQLGGSCKVSAIRAQIEQTVRQLADVDSVVISIDGGDLEEALQP